MIKSMTGFGRASFTKGSFRISAEIRSVNHRFFDYSAYIPSAFAKLETDIRNLLQERLKRGKVTLSISVSNGLTSTDQLVLNEDKLKFYIQTIRKISKRYKLPDNLSADSLLTLPGLLTVEKKEVGSQYEAQLKATVLKAAEELLKMRQKEGIALAKDLIHRAKSLEKAVLTIEQTTRKIPEEYKAQLQKRMEALNDEIKVDPDRLAREVAFYVDRLDITEEIVRERHHIDFFIKTVKSDKEAGKELDFIMQEMQREINTIGSKSQNTLISEQVVYMKSELEKMREQVQNIA